MRPFLLVNAGSGGGQAQGAILAAAADLGLDHHEAEPGDDFTAILEQAVADGADVLAAAGGDGTLSTTADVAMAHDLPMVVVPAGTRNHFTLDLGLDLSDPVGVLRRSLAPGFARRVDVGVVNGATFLNNVSLGLYAAAVGRHGYREHKRAALLAATHEALHPEQDETMARLTVPVPGNALSRELAAGFAAEPASPQPAVPGGTGSSTAGRRGSTAAVLVANNAYMPTFAPGRRLRGRLDGGEIWVYVGGAMQKHASVAARVAHAADAAVHAALFEAAFGTTTVRIGSDRAEVPVAVDGELRLDLTAPFDLSCRVGGLRLLVPDDPAPAEVHLTLVW